MRQQEARCGGKLDVVVPLLHQFRQGAAAGEQIGVIALARVVHGERGTGEQVQQYEQGEWPGDTAENMAAQTDAVSLTTTHGQHPAATDCKDAAASLVTHYPDERGCRYLSATDPCHLLEAVHEPYLKTAGQPAEDQRR